MLIVHLFLTGLGKGDGRDLGMEVVTDGNIIFGCTLGRNMNCQVRLEAETIKTLVITRHPTFCILCDFWVQQRPCRKTYKRQKCMCHVCPSCNILRSQMGCTLSNVEIQHDVICGRYDIVYKFVV